MKDFVKWLGVNEKVAKVAVWMLIIMVFLIITNTMLESTGFPNYKITYSNLKEVGTAVILDYTITWLITILNFYSIVLLVFPLKETKKIFKYSVLYLLLNILIAWGPFQSLLQIFIIIFSMVFCYLYSGKQWKYLIYGFIACLANIAIQGVWYLSKVRFIDYTKASDITKVALSLDYFIIMIIIILVKEIYLKKRGEKDVGRKR